VSENIANFCSLIAATSIVVASSASRVQAYDINVYSISNNQNGRVIKTSVGKFYVGNSGDVIHEVSGYRNYGFWRQEYSLLRIYVNDSIYKFYL